MKALTISKTAIFTILTLFPMVAISHGCRENKKVVGACFNLNGALRVYKGTPSYRIWKTGTQKLLGVPGEEPNFPKTLNDALSKVRPDFFDDNQLCGKYTVCPRSKSKKGWMQFVCIEEAENFSTVSIGKKCLFK